MLSSLHQSVVIVNASDRYWYVPRSWFEREGPVFKHRQYGDHTAGKSVEKAHDFIQAVQAVGDDVTRLKVYSRSPGAHKQKQD